MMERLEHQFRFKLSDWIIICFSLTRIWDLSLEKDEEEEAEFKAKTSERVNAPEDLPPQLLFVHQVTSVHISSPHVQLHNPLLFPVNMHSLILQTGSKRLERTSLAQSNSGNDCGYCSRRF